MISFIHKLTGQVVEIAENMRDWFLNDVPDAHNWSDGMDPAVEADAAAPSSELAAPAVEPVAEVAVAPVEPLPEIISPVAPIAIPEPINAA